MISARFFNPIAYCEATHVTLEELKSENGYLYAWCIMHYAKKRGIEHITATDFYTDKVLNEMRKWSFNDVSAEFKNAIHALEFLAYDCYHNKHSTCDVVGAAIYLGISFDKLCKELMTFGLLSFDESNATFNFDDSKLIDYFSVRYLISCYENNSFSCFKHQWRQTWGSLENVLFEIAFTEKTSTLHSFVYDNAPNTLKKFINLFYEITDQIKNLIETGYQLQIGKSVSELSVTLIYHQDISEKKQAFHFAKLQTQMDLYCKNGPYDNYKSTVMTVEECEDKSINGEIFKIQGPAKTIDLLADNIMKIIQDVNAKLISNDQVMNNSRIGMQV